LPAAATVPVFLFDRSLKRSGAPADEGIPVAGGLGLIAGGTASLASFCIEQMVFTRSSLNYQLGLAQRHLSGGLIVGGFAAPIVGGLAGWFLTDGDVLASNVGDKLEGVGIEARTARLARMLDDNGVARTHIAPLIANAYSARRADADIERIVDIIDEPAKDEEGASVRPILITQALLGGRTTQEIASFVDGDKPLNLKSSTDQQKLAAFLATGRASARPAETDLPVIVRASAAALEDGS
jgi:hypothetical protein